MSGPSIAPDLGWIVLYREEGEDDWFVDSDRVLRSRETAIEIASNLSMVYAEAKVVPLFDAEHHDPSRLPSSAHGAALAVAKAWAVPGPRPGFHIVWQNKLMAEWPVLAKAVDALARVIRE